MASTTTTTTVAAGATTIQPSFKNNWVPSGTYWVPASIESQCPLSIWLTQNDTKPSQHTACLTSVFTTAVFETVIDLRAFARGADFARRGVVYDCPTNAARIQNMCIEIFVDRESSQTTVEVERVLARCPELKCLTVEVFSQDAKDGCAVRQRILEARGNGGSLLSELCKRAGSLVSVEPRKYLADC